jgi:hypothetical protein
MSLVFWSKVYLDLQKKRASWTEKRVDLALDLSLALIFSFAFIDLFMSATAVKNLLEMIKNIPR